MILQIKSLKYTNALAASITRGEMHYTVHRDNVTVPNIVKVHSLYNISGICDCKSGLCSIMMWNFVYFGGAVPVWSW